MNNLALGGVATNVVRNLARIRRYRHEETCAYFCDRNEFQFARGVHLQHASMRIRRMDVVVIVRIIRVKIWGKHARRRRNA